jgi:uncharacterized RDD family membrane protein YckC
VLAEWPQRAIGGLIDFVAPTVILLILSQLNSVISAVASLAAIAWYIYVGYLNGTTGQSIGHQVAGVKVVGEQTGEVIGAGTGILRTICHVLDSIICYIGWLFPLWDAKKNTLADKIIRTSVINLKA